MLNALFALFVGGITGTFVALDVMHPSLWWIGMIVGAFVCGTCFAPRENWRNIVAAAHEAFKLRRNARLVAIYWRRWEVHCTLQLFLCFYSIFLLQVLVLIFFFGPGRNDILSHLFLSFLWSAIVTILAGTAFQREDHRKSEWYPKGVLDHFPFRGSLWFWNPIGLVIVSPFWVMRKAGLVASRIPKGIRVTLKAGRTFLVLLAKVSLTHSRKFVMIATACGVAIGYVGGSAVLGGVVSAAIGCVLLDIFRTAVLLSERRTSTAI